jgi:D-glycero-D-manno-heptose 1,7-bisphosphate phosphatase
LRNKAVFLDRDGTLIVDKIYLNDPSQIEYLPDVFEALKLLSNAGYMFLIATNQSGIAKGIVDPKNLHMIHQIIKSDFAKHGVDIRDFYFAPFPTGIDHEMRKPNCGMLMAGAKEHLVDLSQSWMIGDRMTDVEAGRRAGTKTLLLTGTESPADSPFEPPTAVVDGLMEAAQFILGQP